MSPITAKEISMVHPDRIETFQILGQKRTCIVNCFEGECISNSSTCLGRITIKKGSKNSRRGFDSILGIIHVFSLLYCAPVNDLAGCAGILRRVLNGKCSSIWKIENVMIAQQSEHKEHLPIFRLLYSLIRPGCPCDHVCWLMEGPVQMDQRSLRSYTASLASTIRPS